MRLRFAALTATLLLASLLPAAVSAAGSPGAASAAAQSRASVLAYWTPARMRSARPRDMVVGTGQVVASKGKPGGGGGNPGGGGGGGSGTVTGASWPASVSDPITRATGKVYFEMGGGAWICSGSVVRDTRTGYSLVLTAGHCAVDESTGEFATNWMFIPAFDLAPSYTCSSTAYGCWTASALVVRSEFAGAGAFNTTAVTHDWAFAVVAGGGKTPTANLQLDATAGGAFALDATAAASGTELTALGYPAAGKYHGNDLIYCRGPIGFDPYTGNETYSMACNMTGGSSGGPWLANAAAGFGATLRSLNSYGYSGIRNMYGPIFNTQTSDTYNAANSATSGDIEVGP